MKYTKVAFASAFLISSLTPQLQAGFVDWLGTTSEDWSDNSNWQYGNGVGVDDTAEIFNSGVTMAPAAVLSGSASWSRKPMSVREWRGHALRQPGVRWLISCEIREGISRNNAEQ